MKFKAIVDEEGNFYNFKKDLFQGIIDFDCLREEQVVNLTISYMVECKVETYELVKVT